MFRVGAKPLFLNSPERFGDSDCKYIARSFTGSWPSFGPHSSSARCVTKLCEYTSWLEPPSSSSGLTKPPSSLTSAWLSWNSPSVSFLGFFRTGAALHGEFRAEDELKIPPDRELLLLPSLSSSLSLSLLSSWRRSLFLPCFRCCCCCGGVACLGKETTRLDGEEALIYDARACLLRVMGH